MAKELEAMVADAGEWRKRLRHVAGVVSALTRGP
jgi:hypothetical protein